MKVKSILQQRSRHRFCSRRLSQGPANQTLRRQDSLPHPPSLTNRSCRTYASASCVPTRSALPQRSRAPVWTCALEALGENSHAVHCACALLRVAQVAEVGLWREACCRRGWEEGPRREGNGDEGRVDVERQSGAVVRSGKLGDGGEVVLTGALPWQRACGLGRGV